MAGVGQKKLLLGKWFRSAQSYSAKGTTLRQLISIAGRLHFTCRSLRLELDELAALREVAIGWMERLAEFRPHLSGAVWRGTATRLNDIHLQLYCDDSKSAEILLLSKGLDYDVSSAPGPRGGTVDRLSLTVNCEALGEPIGLHLTILDADDLRGALKPDARGRTERGDLVALRRLLAETPEPHP